VVVSVRSGHSGYEQGPLDAAADAVVKVLTTKYEAAAGQLRAYGNGPYSRVSRL
jgi:hypothetical protein